MDADIAKGPEVLELVMKQFSRRPDGHYEFRVSEGVAVDKSVFEKWSDKKDICFALKSQIIRARERALSSYDALLNMIDDSMKP